MHARMADMELRYRGRHNNSTKRCQVLSNELLFYMKLYSDSHCPPLQQHNAQSCQYDMLAFYWRVLWVSICEYVANKLFIIFMSKFIAVYFLFYYSVAMNVLEICTIYMPNSISISYREFYTEHVEWNFDTVNFEYSRKV